MSDESLFRLMADHAPVMLWKAGEDGLCTFFNSVWLEFSGRTMEQELGNGWAEGVHPEDFQRCMDTFMTAFVERRRFRMEYRLRRADGAYRWLLDTGVPHFHESGAFVGFIGSCVDITDMREADEENRRLADALRQRVREREVLLREIHHRVRNSLQLVSSIVAMHGRTLEGQARIALEEAQTRVHSIALVHEKLYESESLADVDFGKYLQELTAMLMHAVGPGDHVRLALTVGPMTLPLDQAVPCGLVVNELVTNALRHAFVDGRSGTIRIDARIVDDARIEVSVADDGVGLPDSVDLRAPRGLGLDLVATLTNQLDAVLVVERERGTAFRFTFARAG
jgi:PAS domain S-box-containing protein